MNVLHLAIFLLGGFEATLDGSLVTGFKTEKARALLAYLAVERERAHRRQSLVGVLWPDYPEKYARANLRQILTNLRQVLKDVERQVPILLVEGETIQINPESDFWLDVMAVEKAASASQAEVSIDDLRTAIAQYRGGFLEGFSLKDSPVFDHWTYALHERYQGMASTILGRLGDYNERTHDYEKAADYARRRLELEPWQEQAHRQLMRLLVMKGQRLEALAQYEACRKALKNELGVEPSAETIRLYESIRDGDLSSVDQTKHRFHNLPVQLTSFIGRETETAFVCKLLSEHRMVTLTGSGGTGKTRLCLQAAEVLFEHYPNGIMLVELSALADPLLVPQAVASSLNLDEMPGKNILDSLQDYLRSKHFLLILDNCEHLLEACTSLADRLLRSCPELTILASSREILGVVGEASYRVPPMALPDTSHLPPVEKLAEYDAVRLFVERARLVSPGFGVTESNAVSVAQVVSRLDGIPLAIELAAARLRILSVKQVAQRLDDVFRLLTGGSRTVLPRHQTLRALIDWSYNLLTDPERILLRRLSVFAGEWTLEAAEQVCTYALEACQPLCPEDFLDLLLGLVDKSLILTTQGQDDEVRFRMLETIRQYAHEKLVDEKEAAAIRTRHLAFYLRLAQELGLKIHEHGQLQTLDRLELELDNLRLALEWALQTDVEAELRLVTAIHWFWQIRDFFTEAIEWLERGFEAEKQRFIETSRVLDRAIRAKALASLGHHYEIVISRSKKPMQDYARKFHEEALSIYRELDTEHNPELSQGMAWVLVRLGYYRLFSSDLAEVQVFGKDDPVQAQVFGLEALNICRSNGDTFGIGESLELLAACESNPARQLQLFQEKIAINEASGNIVGVAGTLLKIGVNAYYDGEYEKACEAFKECYRLEQQINHLRNIAFQLLQLGWISLALGDLLSADEYLKQSLALYNDLGNHDNDAEILFVQSQHRIAAGLFDQAAEVIESTWHIYQKTGSQVESGDVLYTRLRLARLVGNYPLAKNYADELLSLTEIYPHHVMWAKVELGHLALQNGDLGHAGILYREGLQLLINAHETWVLAYPLDGLALLAAQGNELERATRLFGTRWCRGFYHYFAPSERSQRDAIKNTLRAALGIGRFEQIYEESRSMTLEQVVMYALEDYD
jgi:predicted ATPase/DNA-binding SARP family transcriptional activator/Tfp pilus assembly protein PilF